MKVFANSEIGQMRAALLGSVETYVPHPAINSVQKYHYKNSPPSYDKLLLQHAQLAETLADFGIDVSWVKPRKDCPNQLNTRDVAVTIGETFVIGCLREPIRKAEVVGVEEFASGLASDVVSVASGVVEGGDILVDRDTIYVGLSQRTDRRGFEFLATRFAGRFNLVALTLVPPFLHLDVVFNLLPEGLALIHRPGLAPDAVSELSTRYNLIDVDADEQARLATNVLIVSPNDVITDKRNARLNRVLRAKGFNLAELDFSEINKIGGSFRCAVCPLIRDPV